MPAEPTITVEVVYASTQKQVLASVELARDATVGDAIEHALAAEFPSESLARLQAGIWGRPVERSRVLIDGDRVELYRPLRRDPRDARRELAAAGKFMSGSGQGGGHDRF